MTEEIFREDAYAVSCEATVLAIDQAGIELDRTVFYYESGGQPGDRGTLLPAIGSAVKIIDTQKDKLSGRHVHLYSASEVKLIEGDKVTAVINWDYRHRLMRMHSALHLLCAIVDAQVTGAKVDIEKSRIDFNLEGTKIDKAYIQEAIDDLIAADLPLVPRWVSKKELEDKPELIRTMSVKPPATAEKVRLVEIQGTDLQPCGGTHVSSTSEIGKLIIGKIENKGKHNRRVNVRLDG